MQRSEIFWTLITCGKSKDTNFTFIFWFEMKLINCLNFWHFWDYAYSKYFKHSRNILDFSNICQNMCHCFTQKYYRNAKKINASWKKSFKLRLSSCDDFNDIEWITIWSNMIMIDNKWFYAIYLIDFMKYIWCWCLNMCYSWRECNDPNIEKQILTHI